jgi:hypothetical protein
LRRRLYNEAATRIQAAVRGWLARKRFRALRASPFAHARRGLHTLARRHSPLLLCALWPHVLTFLVPCSLVCAVARWRAARMRRLLENALKLGVLTVLLIVLVLLWMRESAPVPCVRLAPARTCRAPPPRAAAAPPVPLPRAPPVCRPAASGGR